ncbi:methyl-CpG-binding domain-containing protein 9-like [Magnolia sinica]|uniref:methyl-CpG-binding domain-containing protein 9-like n=1 Tax=Magnolia sinica TaxID=86752 RepID=UPI002659DC67|nr:methyl-CpG-binding domain-containing protein 9-like [Magnolia sinica]
MTRCKDIVGSSDGDLRSLSSALLKIKDSLDRALCIYRSPKGCKEKAFCICCSNDLEHRNVVTCVTCKDWYHLSCMRPPLANVGMAKEYKCPFCLSIETGAISKNGRHPLISRETCPELKMFNELLCDARDFHAGITETDIVQDIVD